jgi:hypothetical protein
MIARDSGTAIWHTYRPDGTEILAHRPTEILAHRPRYPLRL